MDTIDVMPNQQKIQELLVEAVTILCQNSLPYKSQIHIDGLIGITIDKHQMALIKVQKDISKLDDKLFRSELCRESSLVQASPKRRTPGFAMSLAKRVRPYTRGFRAHTSMFGSSALKRTNSDQQLLVRPEKHAKYVAVKDADQSNLDCGCESELDEPSKDHLVPVKSEPSEPEYNVVVKRAEDSQYNSHPHRSTCLMQSTSSAVNFSVRTDENHCKRAIKPGFRPPNCTAIAKPQSAALTTGSASSLSPHSLSATESRLSPSSVHSHAENLLGGKELVMPGKDRLAPSDCDVKQQFSEVKLESFNDSNEQLLFSNSSFVISHDPKALSNYPAVKDYHHTVFVALCRSLGPLVHVRTIQRRIRRSKSGMIKDVLRDFESEGFGRFVNSTSFLKPVPESFLSFDRAILHTEISLSDYTAAFNDMSSMTEVDVNLYRSEMCSLTAIAQ